MTEAFREFTDVTANPAAANAAIAAVLADEPVEIPKPEIPVPPDTFVRLPSGRKAEVRELTGEHEERIAKARSSITRWLDAVLESGVESIDGKPVDARALDNLLVGDRDHLLLEISRVTYGDEVEIGEMTCAKCDDTYTATVTLSDVDPQPLNGETQFDVPLRNGRKAVVRLATGADQKAFLEDENLTAPERNSILLSRCVLALEDADGEQHIVAGFPSLVRGLGIRDRQKILSSLSERQPGPRYDEITHEHECGEKTRIALGMMHLFPGL